MIKQDTNKTKEMKAELLKHKNQKKAKTLQRFFKTGKGEYGEGDVFLGIAVPLQRKIAKKFLFLRLEELEALLSSPIHEHRFCALIILIAQYRREGSKTKKEIFNLYLKKIKQINNWDLVDISAPHILGEHLFLKERGVLYKLARSKNLWERRIAIISTFCFIRKGQFKDTIQISEMLLHDEHDLIHKAVGWMLREIGKRSDADLKRFLEAHKHKMPRTMLRYSIEKLSEKERKRILLQEP